MDDPMKYADKVGKKVAKEPAPVAKITLATSTTPLGKRYSCADGKLIKQKGGALSQGVGRVVEIGCIADLAAELERIVDDPELQPATGAIYGVPKGEIAQFYIASQKVHAALQERVDDLPTITRTRADFEWPKGAGVMILDRDAPDDAEVPTVSDEGQAWLHALEDAVPAFSALPCLWWVSSSSFMYDRKTGTCLTGQKGERLWLLVKDASDIKRPGKVLYRRLWLAGYGRHDIGESGAAYPRTVVDEMVWDPEHWDFVGGGVVDATVEQRRGRPICYDEDATGNGKMIPPAAQFIDTRAVFPDLNDAEMREFNKLVAASKAAVKGECSEKREHFVVAKVAEMVGDNATEIDRKRARRTIETALSGGDLRGEFTITVIDATGAETVVTVDDILTGGAKYNRVQTLDPLEPNYDGRRVVGMIFVNKKGVYINSFAHGGRKFMLIGGRRGDMRKPVDIINDGGVDPSTWDIDMFAEPGMVGWPLYDARLRAVSCRYAFSGQGHSVDVLLGKGVNLSGVAAVRNADWGVDCEVSDGKKTKIVRMNPVSALIGTEEKIVLHDVAYMQSRPGSTDIVTDYVDDDETPYSQWQVLNLYRQPKFSIADRVTMEERYDVGAVGQLLIAYLRHLLRDVEVRAQDGSWSMPTWEYVLHWLARKLQHPNERGLGLIFVTPEKGTGRTTLFTLMMEMIGMANCAAIGVDEIIGPQAHFQDALCGKVLVCMNELMLSPSDMSPQAARAVGNRLRGMIDTAVRPVTYKLKGTTSITTLDYSSWMMATNEIAAIPFDLSERRLAVLECNRVKLRAAPAAVRGFVEELGYYPEGVPRNRAMILAVREFLLGLETCGRKFADPATTDVAAVMASTSEDSSVTAARGFINELPADRQAFRRSEIETHIRLYLQARGQQNTVFVTSLVSQLLYAGM